MTGACLAGGGCLTGYKGNLCTECGPGLGRSGLYDCGYCPPNAQNIVVLIVALILIFIAAGLLVISAQQVLNYIIRLIISQNPFQVRDEKIAEYMQLKADEAQKKKLEMEEKKKDEGNGDNFSPFGIDTSFFKTKLLNFGSSDEASAKVHPENSDKHVELSTVSTQSSLKNDYEGVPATDDEVDDIVVRDEDDKPQDLTEYVVCNIFITYSLYF